MRWLMTLIVFGVFCVTNVAAQEATATPESMHIIERCIETLIEPAPDWRFDGTLITYKEGDGIYGFRADFPSRYYIAFDNDREYGRFGSFSPDGRWFADYVGGKALEYSMMLNSSYFVTAIRIVSTLPDGKSYRVPFELYNYSVSASFAPVVWLDNAHFAVLDDKYPNEWHFISPFESTIRTATEMEIQQAKDLRFSGNSMPEYYSPIYRDDGKNPTQESTPAILSKRVVDGKIRLLINDFANNRLIDPCIETNSFVVSPTGEQMAVSIGGDKGFIYVLDLKDWALYRLNLAANRLVAWIADS